jgi:hypothetical protein
MGGRSLSKEVLDSIVMKLLLVTPMFRLFKSVVTSQLLDSSFANKLEK